MFLVPGSLEQGLLTYYMNKQTMTELAKEVGLSVPDSTVVKGDIDLKTIEFPCIIKPILSKDGKKQDIKTCNNIEDLRKAIEEGSCYSYQVQKFLEKDFEYQLIGLSLHGGDELIIPGISHCIRPCPRTNTGFLRYESLNGYNIPLEKCRSFMKKVKYEGLFSMEFLRGKDGVDYFMEANFRNDGNAISVTKAGFNLPYLWYLYCTGKDYKAELNRCNLRPVLIIPELDDIGFVTRKEISICTWIKDIIRTDAFMEYDSNDKKPFFIALKQRILKKIKKIK